MRLNTSIVGSRSALEQSQKSKKLTSFSKVWKSGSQIIVLYRLVPLTDEEKEEAKVSGENPKRSICVGELWGHSVNDIKSLNLKTNFLQTHSEIDYETMEIIKPDISFQFSKVAKLLLEGQKQDALVDAENRAGDDKTTYVTLVSKITEEYNNKRPIISGLVHKTFCECVAIETSDDWTPNKKTMKLVSSDLSDKRLQRLHEILDDDYKNIPLDQDYMEVRYVFGSSGDRKIDGQVDPKPVSEDKSIFTKYPNIAEEAKSMILSSPMNSKVLTNRYNIQNYTESEIKRALAMYTQSNTKYLEKLTDVDKDKLVNAANIIDELKIKILDEDLNKRIQDKLKEDKIYEESNEKINEKIDEEELKEESDTVNVDDLLNKVG